MGLKRFEMSPKLETLNHEVRCNLGEADFQNGYFVSGTRKPPEERMRGLDAEAKVQTDPIDSSSYKPLSLSTERNKGILLGILIIVSCLGVPTTTPQMVSNRDLRTPP